ncbi:MAG: hypothetical protein WAO19_07005 [Candidatus Kryptoniota bacterium]
MAEGGNLAILEYGADSIIHPGQSESGDKYIVKETITGALIGAIDGLGHGTEAAIASDLAVKIIDDHADESVITIARLCHESLNRTRGVVMALASINSTEDTLTWLSIGNVEGTFIRADAHVVPGHENIFTRPGVVGYRLPSLFASVISISKNDMVILSTDGIRNDYAQKILSDIHHASEYFPQMTEAQIGTTTHEVVEQSETWIQKPGIENQKLETRDILSPKNMASYIGTHFSKGSDDALVVVARYKGKPAAG